MPGFSPARIALLCLLALLRLPVAAYELIPNTGHAGFVQDIAVSPDGRIVATASFDRTIRLWTLDGRLLRALQGHGAPVTDVEFHASGALLASVAGDGRLRLWDIDGTELWSVATEFHGMEEPAQALTFSGDTLWVQNRWELRAYDLTGAVLHQEDVYEAKQIYATALTDGQGRPWVALERGVASPETDDLPRVPDEFLGPVVSLALRGDDGEFLVGSDFGCVASLALDENMQAIGAWRLLQSCEEPDNWPLHDTRIVDVVYGRVDGEPIALRADGAMFAWSDADAPVQESDLGLPLGLAAGVAVPEAGVYVVASGGDVIAATRQGTTQIFGSARAHYTSVGFSADGSRFALGTAEGRLEVWNTDGSLAYTTQAHAGGVVDVLWHPGGLLVSRGAQSGDTFRDDLAVWGPGGKLLGRISTVRNIVGTEKPMQWTWGTQATVALSGGFAGTLDLLTRARDMAPLGHELGERWGAEVEGLIKHADGRLLALTRTGALHVVPADGGPPEVFTLPETERFGGGGMKLEAALPTADDGYVTLERSGRLVRWNADGSVAWTRATYAPDSFTAGRFTAAELERQCRSSARLHARGLLGGLEAGNQCFAEFTEGRLAADDLEACSEDPGRLEAIRVAHFEECMADPEARAAFRPIPAEGVFDVDDWRAFTLPSQPWLFWTPLEPIAASPTDGVFATGSWDGSVTIVDGDGERVGGHRMHSGLIHDLAFSPDGRFLVSVDQGVAAVLHDLRSGRSVSLTSDGTDWILWDQEGRFTASRGGADLVSVSGARQAYAVDQFAPALNDPAAVLEPLGLVDEDRAAHYRIARARRYARLGAVADVDPEALPTAEVLGVAKQGDAARVGVRLTAATEAAPIVAWQLWVDDVPLFPREGTPLDAPAPVFEGDVEIELVNGANRVEVVAIDARGARSLRAETRVLHQREATPSLWYAGFGISDYRLDWLPRLFYAAKDARDLGGALDTLGDRFEAVHVRTWLDDEVSADALDEAHAFLAQAAPGDTVVLFIAGHGTYGTDDDGRFYYLLAESEDEDLPGTALDFERVEQVLFGLDARRKLFLMDTCQSGEPVGDFELARYDAAVEAGVLPRVPRPKRPEPDADAAAQAQPERRWLRQRDRLIYADLARRSGAVVFSSAMGNELSNEASFLRNGYFTEGLLQSLTDDAGDVDADGQLTVGELHDAVRSRVQEWSDLGEGPTQNPVIDRDNLRSDLRLPLLPLAERKRFEEPL